MYTTSEKEIDYKQLQKEPEKNPIFKFITIIFLVAILILGIATVVVSAFVYTTQPETPVVSSRYWPKHKYATSFPPPETFQENRGTCWVHGLVGPLEQSYRRNGILKGFLKEDQYVPFSIQAFGISIVKACQDPKNYAVCKELQAGPEMNTTAGGEPAWLYYLPELYDKLFPESLCPYLPEDEDEWKCDDLDKAIKSKKNPIKFNIVDMKTVYDIDDAKELMREKDMALAFSTDVWTNVYYIPCYKDDQKAGGDYSPLCGVWKDRVKCPAFVTKHAEDDLCLRTEQPGYNMDGEWYLNTHFVAEGGHAMQMVGYNDEWITLHGEKGGFAIKNSWHDQLYPWDPASHLTRGGRGSHSLGYWLGEISTWDERYICPNPGNPENWMSCTDLQAGPTQMKNMGRAEKKMANEMRERFVKEKREAMKQNGNSTSNSASNEEKSVEMCLKKEYADELLRVLRQPFEFECHNASRYKCDTTKYRYFLDSFTHDTNSLVTAKFVTIQKSDGKTAGTFTLREVPPSMVADAFQPLKSQLDFLANDKDNCGYYWMPYDVMGTVTRYGETWNANYFDIEWADSSYASMSYKYSGKDYSYLKKSVLSQKKHTFDGPLPLAKRTGKYM
ncbi:putative papain family cysteine protease domain containing protein [Monocercomonoides exilis]|uniref:putative papain family cysteine protease domain containing protein n=1 Tax=Monocercomonoides exilis TaxID=2049356 RepID=UPI00355AA38A|nr:putative papain family cysteine protease domain containing protein [Monocercomonoides exilis]|eukprot:MONOS_7084.1-p1 / transcript=MONOS_7084.1 / gene=MONOS_7084 / organism=Monocercomonoides_exilis_PA203 / gene_product=papain family cysteine protease domain containing protein / transcript_product=papain family cysteine protease domain containing protein / location=Mono_scaffold00235:16641-18828(-) / protein_length=614 / sequence_SO=supercontig / SO=protein_coding / is_pseudo=false